MSKKENMEIKVILHKASAKRWFRNVIHNLLRRADVRGSADIIYHYYLPYYYFHMSLLCGSSIVIDVTK